MSRLLAKKATKNVQNDEVIYFTDVLFHVYAIG